jgi:hypothetical protein
MTLLGVCGAAGGAVTPPTAIKASASGRTNHLIERLDRPTFLADFKSRALAGDPVEIRGR